MNLGQIENLTDNYNNTVKHKITLNPNKMGISMAKVVTDKHELTLLEMKQQQTA